MCKILTRLILILVIALSYPVFLLSLPQERIIEFANYPNPFDSRTESTLIIYYLQDNSKTTLKIYDLFGYLVKEYSFNAGRIGGTRGWNRIKWNGENEMGRKVGKGGYICMLYTDAGSQNGRAYHKIGVVH